MMSVKDIAGFYDFLGVTFALWHALFVSVVCYLSVVMWRIERTIANVLDRPSSLFQLFFSENKFSHFPASDLSPGDLTKGDNDDHDLGDRWRSLQVYKRFRCLYTRISL